MATRSRTPAPGPLPSRVITLQHLPHLGGRQLWATLRRLWQYGPQTTVELAQATGNRHQSRTLATLQRRRLVRCDGVSASAALRLPATLDTQELPAGHREGRILLALHIAGPPASRAELARQTGIGACELTGPLPVLAVPDPTRPVRQALSACGIPRARQAQLLQDYGADATRRKAADMAAQTARGTPVRSPVAYLTRCLVQDQAVAPNTLPESKNTMPESKNIGFMPLPPYIDSLTLENHVEEQHETPAHAGAAAAPSRSRSPAPPDPHAALQARWRAATGCTAVAAARLIRDCGPRRVAAQLEQLPTYQALYAQAGRRIRDLAAFAAAAVRRGHAPDPRILQRGGAPDPAAVAPLRRRLQQHGMDAAPAAFLSRRWPERTARQLAQFPAHHAHRPIRHAAGWLYRAIERDYAPAPTPAPLRQVPQRPPQGRPARVEPPPRPPDEGALRRHPQLGLGAARYGAGWLWESRVLRYAPPHLTVQLRSWEDWAVAERERAAAVRYWQREHRLHLEVEPPSAALTRPTAGGPAWARICRDVRQCDPRFEPVSTRAAARAGTGQASDLVRWAWRPVFDGPTRRLRLGVAGAGVLHPEWLAQVERSLQRVCGADWRLEAEVAAPAVARAQRPTWRQTRAWWLRAARTPYGRVLAAQLRCLRWDAAAAVCVLAAPAAWEPDLRDTLAWSLHAELAALRGESWQVQVAPDAAPARRPDAAARRALRAYARGEGVAAAVIDRCLTRDAAAVARQLTWWPARCETYPGAIRTPAGLLTAALQENWDPPRLPDP